MDNININPWFKLIALGMVAGVAKALFAPYREVRTFEVAKDVVDKTADAVVKGKNNN